MTELTESTKRPAFAYSVDSYGPHGSRGSGGYVHGPSEMPRGEALDYLTERMTDLADGRPPPIGWSEWGRLGVHLLDKADAHPGEGQDQIVLTTELRTFGVVVIAEPMPAADSVDLRAMAAGARERMEAELDELLRRAVSAVVGHQDWPGDVAPLTVHRLHAAIEDVLAQLIEAGLEQRRSAP